MTTLKKLILENIKLSKKYQIQGDLDDDDQKRSDEIDELMRPLKSKILKYIGSKGIKDLPISDRKKLLELLNSGKMTTEKEVDKEFKKYQGGESESEEEEEPLSKTQKTALIKKIPDWTYTDKQIHKIVDAIREGVITRFSGFPTPTKKGEKVEVEFVKNGMVLKN